MNEITEPSLCTFKIEKGQNASLNCKLNIEEFKSIKIFTFNTTEIDFYNSYIISFPNLKNVYLINNFKKKKIGLIIGIVIGSVSFITILIVGIYLYKKKCKKDDKSQVEKYFKNNNKNHSHDKTFNYLKNYIQ